MNGTWGRILSRTMVTDKCWIWLGSVCTSGYGQISVRNQLNLVHRLAYELHAGPIPDGMVIDHICHDPKVCAGGKCVHRRCVNPSHLKVATEAENLARQTPAAKAECAHGHPYDAQNTGRTPDGRRYCKACRVIKNRKAQLTRHVPKEATEVRAWALRQGIAVGARGRLSADLFEQYRAWRAAA